MEGSLLLTVEDARKESGVAKRFCKLLLCCCVFRSFSNSEELNLIDYWGLTVLAGCVLPLIISYSWPRLIVSSCFLMERWSDWESSLGSG